MDEDKKPANEEAEKPIDKEQIEPVALQEPAEPKEETAAPVATDPSQPPKKSHRFKRFLRTKKGIATIILTTILIIAGVLMAIPATRYGILGTVIKKSVSVVVTDSSTMKPVSQATISLGDMTAKTSKTGEAIFDNMPVGEYALKVAKSYYKSSEMTYTVPIFGEAKRPSVSLIATGRAVTVHVTNKISGAVLTGATVAVNDTSAVTDDKGEAVIILPADKKTFQGKITLDGYNDSAIDITVSDQASANEFSITPSGMVYYLSKQTGKINVMKAQLDGTNASVVVEGTGNENDRGTVLLAARDWSYMALLAKRDAKKAGQLHLVDAKSSNLKIIDEGDAEFQLIGWSNHRFIYMVTRNNRNIWEPNTQRLKSYDAETGKLTILDENAATGSNHYDYQYESLQIPYILENKIVYAKTWGQNYGNPAPSDKKSAIISVNPDGSQKQRLKEFTMQRAINIQAKLYEPQEIYFRVSIDDAEPSQSVYYEYENNTIKTTSNTDDKFYNIFYPTYLVSPNSQKTFWYEPRDGKNTLIVGDKNGKDGVTLANQSEYKTYGWYGDKYVLVAKNDSELFIAPADKPLEQPLKITNYHKPSVTYPGYGYGYGGL